VTNDTKLTPEQHAEGMRRYDIGRAAGKAARKLRTDVLSEKHGLSSRAIDRIAGKGIKYAHSSQAYQDVPSDTIDALWADITERDRQRSIRAENTTVVIARDLGVDEMKLRSQCEYHAKKQDGRTPVADRKPESPVSVRSFLAMPSASPAPFVGYY
jgi:hypothetical protein